MDKKVLTKEGLSKLQEELTYLKNEKRPQVADRIRQAKELGDLSENAEYQEAKEEQSFVEGRVLELEHLIKTSELAKENKNKDIISIGSEVSIDKEGQVLDFTIVGSTEADPLSGRISIESPFGDALMDKKVGEEIEVNLPTGKVVCKILKVK